MSIALYRDFRRALKGTPFTGRFMPYQWSPLPNKLSARWLVYAEMLDEFSRGLANVINDLTHHEQRLRAWDVVVAPLSDEKKMAATHEFIDVIATVAVNLPYVISSRFNFAVAHLCHQANRLKLADWKDNLPLDGDITQSDADQQGKHWRRYSRLKLVLEKVNSREFVSGTRNFRNVYTHRLEPRFVFGMSQIVTRTKLEDGRICYGVGGQPALELGEVADLLLVQRDQCYLAFEAFQRLVNEHSEAIVASQTS